MLPDGREGRPLLPRDFIVRSEYLGLPQTRHRVILVGILEDTNAQLCPLAKSELMPSV